MIGPHICDVPFAVLTLMDKLRYRRFNYRFQGKHQSTLTYQQSRRWLAQRRAVGMMCRPPAWTMRPLGHRSRNTSNCFWTNLRASAESSDLRA